MGLYKENMQARGRLLNMLDIWLERCPNRNIPKYCETECPHLGECRWAYDRYVDRLMN